MCDKLNCCACTPCCNDVCTAPDYSNLGCPDIKLDCIILKKDYPCLNLSAGATFLDLMDSLETLACSVKDEICSCPNVVSLAVQFDQRGLNNPLLYRVKLLWQPVLGATSYVIEYKATSSLVWNSVTTTSLTSYNSLIVNNSITSYDFRIKAVCNNCSSDWTQRLANIIVDCAAPTNAYYNPTNNTLVWESAPNQLSGSFSVEMRRDDQSTFSTINVIAVETPAASGIYIASLSAIVFSPNYVYHFCISNICGSTQNVYSDHGQGCAFDCAIPNQSVPSVSGITANSAQITWSAIQGVTEYELTYTNNSVTNTIVTSLLTYNITGINTSLVTTVTVKGYCTKSDSSSPCGGKTITF